MEEKNPQLTRGLSLVYPRFITGTASALRCWLLTSVPTPICRCKPFSCKACLGKFHRSLHRKSVVSTSFQKHEQTKSYLNRRRNKTSGGPPVYQRFINGTRSALCSWLPNNGTTPICLRTCHIQNPDIPRASRVAAPGGAAGRGRARLSVHKSCAWEAKVHRTVQGIERTSLQRPSRNTNRRNPI